MQDVPETIKPKALSALEQARKEYHDATVEMASIDAKLIDAAATLEELKAAHGEAIIRANRAREALVDARSPAPDQTPARVQDATLTSQGPLSHGAVDAELVD
jgi:hypothetical protein